MVVPAFLSVMVGLPMTAGQPPLLGDWIITGSESLSGGSYEVHDGDIIIRDGGTLTLDGTEIRMDDTTGPQYRVEVQSGGTLIMRNGALIRSEHNNSNWYSFFIWDGATARITDSNISDVGSIFANWQDLGIFIESDDVLIDNTDITRGGFGIMMFFSDATITNNTIYDNQGTGVYTELGEPVINDNHIIGNGVNGWWWGTYPGIQAYNSNATIDGNTVDNNGWNGGNYGSGIQVALSHVSVRNNTITNNADQGISVDNHASGTIADNDIRWNDDQGIGIRDHSTVDVINNKVYTNNEVGIYVTDHSASLLKDNYVNTTDEYAILITNDAKPKLVGNTVKHWGTHDAVEINDNSVVDLIGNDIFSQNNYGIDISHFVKANLEGNTIDSGSVALDINDFSEGRLIGNTLISRWTHGFNLGYYSKAFGERNVIDSLDEGIDMWSYSSLKLYDTDITSNLDYGIEIRGRCNFLLDGGSITSQNYIGVMAAESTVDIINASITAPNNNDIRLGTSSAMFPGLVRILNTTYNQSSTGFDNDNGVLNVSWYAEKIWAEWQNERNVPGADVWIENIHGQVAYSGMANRHGEINWLPVQEYTQNRTHRNDFTRHNFSAEKNGVSSFAGANVNQNVNIRIILQDIIHDPLINIANPVDEGIYNTSIVWVNGTAEDPESGIHKVTVIPIGMPEITANGTEDWGTNITVADGDWDLSVNATNYAGVKETKTISITVDTVEPDLFVTYPAPVDLVNTANITVEGTTEIGAVVTVNGMNASVDPQGNFNLTITLPEGMNSVIVASRDIALNYNHSYHMVEVDLTPPPLVVFDPEGDIITAQSPYIATGWVEASANLSVNGTTISHVGEPWTTSITLNEGINMLEFLAIDPAGNPTTVIREVTYDTIPPDVEVWFPPEDHLTNVTELSLGGNVQDLTYDRMTINGVNMTLDGNGNYTHFVNLSEGMNHFEIIVYDKAGHKTVIHRSVTLDTIAPPLEVREPEQDLLTNIPQVHIIGMTEVGAMVTMNGINVVVSNSSGSFDHVYTLLEGSNVLTIVSKDPAGNPSIVVRNVDLDTIPPELKVTSPKKGASHNEYIIDVEGKASDNYAFDKLLVNGKEINVKNGKFSTSVALKDGSNKIIVKAIDLAGNEVVEEIKLTREGLTGMQSGLLGLGIVFLIVGLVVGMFLSRSLKPKPKPDYIPPDEEDEPGPGSEEPDEAEEPMDDESEEDGPDKEPEDPEPKEPEPEKGPEPEPGAEKKPEGQEAEGEAPPEDADKSIDNIMTKLNK